ncbi:MAG: hypothetical protein AAF138_07120 [Planctomycetota bacterium]
MTRHVVSTARTPECPRCGYDLSGETERWTDACPIEGTCSECGLAFAWREILNPELRVLPWLYEHRQDRPRRTLAVTAWRAARPWSFWRAVRLAHTVRPGRALVAGGVAFALWYLVSLVCVFVCEAAVAWPQVRYFGLNATHALQSSAARAAAPPVNWYFWGFGWGAWIHPQRFIAGVAMVLAPMTLWLMPVSLRRGGVRRAHLVRAAGYGFGQAPIVWVLGAVVWATWSLLEFGIRGSVRWDGPETIASNSGLTLALAWVWMWLWVVVGRYLRLPRPAWVASWLWLVAVLAASAIAAVAAPNELLGLFFML